MLSGCYIPCPDIQKYNIQYKRDKESGTWFDTLDFQGGLNFFEVDRMMTFFKNS